MLAKVTLLLAAVRGLLGLIQPITEAVKQFETPGHGAEKKAAVLGVIKAAVLAAEGALKVDLPEQLVMDFVGSVIDGVVGFYNAVGVFKRKDEKLILPTDSEADQVEASAISR